MGPRVSCCRRCRWCRPRQNTGLGIVEASQVGDSGVGGICGQLAAASQSSVTGEPGRFCPDGAEGFASDLGPGVQRVGTGRADADHRAPGTHANAAEAGSAVTAGGASARRDGFRENKAHGGARGSATALGRHAPDLSRHGELAMPPKVVAAKVQASPPRRRSHFPAAPLRGLSQTTHINMFASIGGKSACKRLHVYAYRFVGGLRPRCCWGRMARAKPVLSPA